MVVEIVFAVIVVAFVGWLSRRAMHDIWTGTYPRDEGSDPGPMPSSGPDISSGIGGP